MIICQNSEPESDSLKCIENCDVCLNTFQCHTCSSGYFPTTNGTKCEKYFCSYKIINFYSSNNIPNLHEINVMVKNYAKKYKNIENSLVRYVNDEMKYSVNIFKDYICTCDLMDMGYFQVGDGNIIEELQNSLESDDPIIQVYFKNKRYEFLIFYDNDGNRIYLDKVCPSCLKEPYIVLNDYTKAINISLGTSVLNVVQDYDIDVFNYTNDYFKDICTNLQIQGFDLPLYKRKNKLFQGYNKDVNDYLCGANCEETYRASEALFAFCQCPVFDDIKDQFSTNFNVTINPEENPSLVEEIQGSFKLFKCLKMAFNKVDLSNNFGFKFSIFCIAFQIICFIRFWCKKNSLSFNIITNHPPQKKNNEVLREEEKKTSIDKGSEEMFENENKKEKKEEVPNSGEKISNLNLSTEVKDFNNMNEQSLVYNEDMENILKDYLPLDRVKAKDQRSFCYFFCYIIALKLPISNILVCFCDYQTYISLELRLIKFIFMVMMLLFLNALSLTQVYIYDKYVHFNKTHFIENAFSKLKIPFIEKFNYSLIHCLPYVGVPVVLYIIIQSIVNVILNMRIKFKKIIMESSTILEEEQQKIKIKDGIRGLQKKMKFIHKILFLVNLGIMLITAFYLTVFNYVYKGSMVDLFGFVFVSLIILHLIGFILALVITYLRFLGKKKFIFCAYDCSKYILEFLNA